MKSSILYMNHDKIVELIHKDFSTISKHTEYS